MSGTKSHDREVTEFACGRRAEGIVQSRLPLHQGSFISPYFRHLHCNQFLSPNLPLMSLAVPVKRTVQGLLFHSEWCNVACVHRFKLSSSLLPCEQTLSDWCLRPFCPLYLSNMQPVNAELYWVYVEVIVWLMYIKLFHTTPIAACIFLSVTEWLSFFGLQQ